MDRASWRFAFMRSLKPNTASAVPMTMSVQPKITNFFSLAVVTTRPLYLLRVCIPFLSSKQFNVALMVNSATFAFARI
jgi:hypothetical protein